jgi:sulfite exporter TauE/SafE
MRVDLGVVLVTGLFAGGISCAAVQGGLLTGLVTRQRAAVPATGRSRAGKSGARRPASATQAVRGTGGKVAVFQRPSGGGQRWSTASDGWRARTVAPPLPLRKRALGALRSARASLGDDLTPVAAFLSGKLLSYTALGALLGALGSVVQLSPAVRVWTQLAAGALVICFGLSQLGVRGFKRFTIEPPASWMRFVRGRARSQAAVAPALLGLATILVPCGITLSMEALALTSGSALDGAAIMAVFILGTSPLFAVLGYAARKAATAWHGRLAVATGLAVLGLGLYTFNGGLTLAGSPLAAANLTQTLGFAPPPATAETVSVNAGHQIATITARPGSYTPANVAVVAGLPTTLVVRADHDNGCTRAFVINGQQYILPDTGDTTIDLGVLKPGTLRYRCGMGMYSGQFTITDQQRS